jgi:hypothetical protein
MVTVWFAPFSSFSFWLLARPGAGARPSIQSSEIRGVAKGDKIKGVEEKLALGLTTPVMSWWRVFGMHLSRPPYNLHLQKTTATAGGRRYYRYRAAALLLLLPPLLLLLLLLLRTLLLLLLLR